MMVILMRRNSREMHGAEETLSTSVLQKTRERMTQNQVVENSHRPLPNFFEKKIIKRFQN